jgi:O-antigen/teichoic acid export membrane protein
LNRIENKSNFNQAFWVGMGSLSSFALSIVSAAILARYFNKTEYGTYKQILFVYNSLLLVFTAGLPRVFSYYLPRYTLEQGKDIVIKVSKVLFICGLALALFLFGFSGIIAGLLKNPELSIGLKYFAIIPIFFLPTLGIEGIFSTYKKTIYIAIYNTLSRLLMLLFIVTPVVLFHGSYLNAIYGWIAVSIITFIMAFKFKNIPFKGVTNQKSAIRMKEIFSYSIPIATASLAGIAIKSADQFYISRYFGAEVFAEYSNGFIQIPFVGMVTSATSMVLMPQFSKIIHENTGIEELLKLWRNALIKSASLIFPMVIFFFFTAKDCMVLLYSKLYSNSAIYFQIAMTLNLFNIIIFAPLLLALGETRFYARIHFASASIIWLFGFIFVKTFNSPISIAILSVSNSVLLVIFALIKSSKILHSSVKQLIPLKNFFIIILTSSLIMAFTSSLFQLSFPSSPSGLKLIILVIIFSILLFSISSRFKIIDYQWIIKPIINNIKMYV